MNRLVVAAVILSFSFASCNKEVPEELTKEQIKYQVDSISAARIKEMDVRAQKDLDYRMKIEVKAKADSILNARQQARDTAAPKPAIAQ
jgi:hypothetical protein